MSSYTEIERDLYLNGEPYSYKHYGDGELPGVAIVTQINHKTWEKEIVGGWSHPNVSALLESRVKEGVPFSEHLRPSDYDTMLDLYEQLLREHPVNNYL